jgi:hypothetical protein
MLLAAELGRPLKGTAKKLPSKPSHGHEGMWTAQARPRMGEATKGGVNFTPWKTCSDLPYSLWDLSDSSGWLGWVAWLVRLWVMQKTRSLFVKISRNTIRISVGPPLQGRRGTWPCAHRSQVHCELCLWIK